MASKQLVQGANDKITRPKMERDRPVDSLGNWFLMSRNAGIPGVAREAYKLKTPSLAP